jgi:monoamine oxidase
MWHSESDEDGDFKFLNSFKCLVDYLKDGIQVELNTPVHSIDYSNVSKDTDGLIRVKSAQGTTYYTRPLVISSPYVLQQPDLMQFHPPLSSEITEALSTTNMHSIVKVFLKFSKPVWPKNLHGMIMTDKDMLLPEIWFHDVTEKALPDEPAKAYLV